MNRLDRCEGHAKGLPQDNNLEKRQLPLAATSNHESIQSCHLGVTEVLGSCGEFSQNVAGHSFSTWGRRASFVCKDLGVRNTIRCFGCGCEMGIGKAVRMYALERQGLLSERCPGSVVLKWRAQVVIPSLRSAGGPRACEHEQGREALQHFSAGWGWRDMVEKRFPAAPMHLHQGRAAEPAARASFEWQHRFRPEPNRGPKVGARPILRRMLNYCVILYMSCLRGGVLSTVAELLRAFADDLTLICEAHARGLPEENSDA